MYKIFCAFCLISLLLFVSECNKNEESSAERKEQAFNMVKAQSLESGKFREGVDFINTDNYANTRLEFFYYIPSGVLEDREHAVEVLVCIPPLSGRGEKFVPPIFKEFAEEEKLVIIAPSFVWDKDNWDTRTSYQFPSVWSGDALLEIIEKLNERYGLQLSRLYLYGFSAGAQFALRFALWRPDLCIACAVHGSGGTIIPEEYVDVKFFVSVGRNDRSRIPKAEVFVMQAKMLGIDVIYRQYPGGHYLPVQQIKDSLRFFKEIRAN